MATTTRFLRFGWVLPDQPNQFYKTKYRDIDEALQVCEDGNWVDGARLIDLGDSYHGQHILIGVWWEGRFLPTREYYIEFENRVPTHHDLLFERLVGQGLVSVLA